MAEGINKVLLLGNLGSDAELSQHQFGARLMWRMATTVSYPDKESGTRKDRTDWHRVVIWGKRAEGLAPHLKKGTKIFVEGRLETRSYDDAQGVKKYVTEVRARELRFFSSGRGAARDEHMHGGVDLNDVMEGRMSPPPLPHTATA